MATFLALTNSVLARLNEVQLTASNFSAARGIQTQAQNAVNESIRYINQREFNYPFNHSTKTETLAPNRKFIIEVIGENVKVNKYGDKLHSLIDDLGWEYQRMGRSGRETYDEICHLLGTIPEDEVYMEI